MLKKSILTAGLLSMLAVVAAGCGSNQPAATTGDAAKAPVATEAAATYVGDDACKACHAKADTAYHATKHAAGALKAITDYKLTSELPKDIALFDGADKTSTKPTKFDLSTAKIYGVMMNEYVLAEVPGFKTKLYRVAKLEKNGDKYDVKAAKSVDVDKDGKEDWQAADGESCAKCHAPGVLVASPTPGISCESCHGAGSNHIAAATDKKKGTIVAQASSMLPNTETCLSCHQSDPTKDDKGTILANNHYGTRNWFAAKHATNGQLTGCMVCHNPHKANAKGQLLRKDNAADICVACHAGAKIDVAKLMWKNTTDERGHLTADHSFGALKYEDMGDDAATKTIEIKNPAYVNLINEAIPDLGK